LIPDNTPQESAEYIGVGNDPFIFIPEKKYILINHIILAVFGVYFQTRYNITERCFFSRTIIGR